MSELPTEEPFKVGDWAENKGLTYRIAAMDNFGFCLLKTRDNEIAFIHAPSCELSDVARIVRNWRAEGC